MTVSLPRVLQACCATVDDARWARGIVDALAPLGQTSGVHALRLERKPGGGVLSALASSVARPVAIDALIAHAAVEGPVARALFAGGQGSELVSTRISRSTRPIASALRAMCAAFGAADVLLVRGDDGGMATIVIAVPMRRHGDLAPRTFRPIAAYLSSALRLRRAWLEQSSDACGMIDVARRAARASVLPADATDAHALWVALLAGRWAVVEQLDEGARCTLLLRRASEHDPLALTPRERDVASRAALGLSNKEIAYALGIGATTVATHLRSAGEKLRAPTRRALIALFAAARVPRADGAAAFPRAGSADRGPFLRS